MDGVDVDGIQAAAGSTAPHGSMRSPARTLHPALSPRTAPSQPRTHTFLSTHTLPPLVSPSWLRTRILSLYPSLPQPLHPSEDPNTLPHTLAPRGRRPRHPTHTIPVPSPAPQHRTPLPHPHCPLPTPPHSSCTLSLSPTPSSSSLRLSHHWSPVLWIPVPSPLAPLHLHMHLDGTRFSQTDGFHQLPPFVPTKTNCLKISLSLMVICLCVPLSLHTNFRKQLSTRTWEKASFSMLP